jgi:hypothetical protein
LDDNGSLRESFLKISVFNFENSYWFKNRMRRQLLLAIASWKKRNLVGSKDRILALMPRVFCCRVRMTATGSIYFRTINWLILRNRNCFIGLFAITTKIFLPNFWKESCSFVDFTVPCTLFLEIEKEFPKVSYPLSLCLKASILAQNLI